MFNPNVAGIPSLRIERTRYVNSFAKPGGNGSFNKPFNTIQAAVDYWEANADWSLGVHVINIARGSYNTEHVRILGQGSRFHFQGEEGRDTSVGSITISNATSASIDAYLISGDYGDLVARSPAVSGPHTFSANQLYITKVNVLGVKGDATPDTTNFLTTAAFYDCFMNGCYSRNARGLCAIGTSSVGTGASWEFLQNNTLFLADLLVGMTNWATADVHIGYDATDAHGRPHGTAAVNTHLPDLIVNGNLRLSGTYPHQVFQNLHVVGDLTLDDTTSVALGNSFIGGNVTVAGGASLDMSYGSIGGDVTASSGVGAVTLEGTEISGAITDPDYRIEYPLRSLTTRYVDLTAPAGGNGTPERPYVSIQDAIDEIESKVVVGVMTRFNIEIAVGNYTIDPILITETDLRLYLRARGNVLLISSGDGIIVSNATKASIATWSSSRNYSDLSARTTPEKGPAIVRLEGTFSVGAAANRYGLAVLGVPGDDTPTTSGLSTVQVKDGVIINGGSGSGRSFYTRNCAAVMIESGRHTGLAEFLQVGYLKISENANLLAGFSVSYDSSDPFGHAKGGYNSAVGYDTLAENGNVTIGEGIINSTFLDCNFNKGLTVGENASVTLKNVAVGEALSINDTATVTKKAGFIGGNVTIAGGASLDMSYGSIGGDVTASSGVGAVTLEGTEISGAITDPDYRIEYPLLPPLQRYVANDASDGGNGSFEKPYKSLQTAIDYFEATHDFLADPWTDVVVFIKSGTYFDNEARILADGARFHFATIGGVAYVYATTAHDTLIVSNGTSASIDTWAVSRDYADLQARTTPVKGPQHIKCSGVYFYNWTGYYGTALLGIKGDKTADTTEFLNSTYILESGTPGALYARNVNWIIQLGRSLAPVSMSGFTDIQVYQCYLLDAASGSLGRNVTIVHDTADAHGRCNRAPGINLFGDIGPVRLSGNLTLGEGTVLTEFNSMVTIGGDLQLDDGASIATTSGPVHIGGNLDINSNSSATISGGLISGNVTVAGGASLDMSYGSIGGDVTASSGVGAVTLEGTEISGAITDPDYRIEYPLLPPRERYIAINAPDGGNGSFEKPYNILQTAIDYFEATIDFIADPLDCTIIVKHGYYTSTKARILADGARFSLVGEGEAGFTQWPLTSDTLIVSNATSASIDTWEISRDYADLQARATPVKGPYAIKLNRMIVYGDSTKCGIALLGVKGDKTADTTEFLSGGVAMDNLSFGPLYARNVNGTIALGVLFGGTSTGTTMDVQLHQCYYMSVDRGNFGRDITIISDTLDLHGRCDRSFYAPRFTSVTVGRKLTLGKGIVGAKFFDVRIGGDLQLDDGASMATTSGPVHIVGNLDVNSNSSATISGGLISGNVETDGAASFRANGVHIQGDLTFASGVGVVQMDGGTYMGALTDPDVKFTRNLGS